MEIVGAIVALFFAGIVFRGVFPNAYDKINKKVGEWADKK